MTADSDMDLEGLLSDVEATMAFTTPKAFKKTLNAFFDNAYDRDPIGDHTVLTTGFPNKYFTIDDDNRSLIPRSCKALYFQDTQTLILTMAGRPHDAAATRFGYHLFRKLDDMGCYNEISSTSRARVSLDNVKKEPDGSWGPFRPGGEPKYATCVLEAAVSESSRALSRDPRIWLEHPESRVTQVIAVKVYRRPEIVVTVWKRSWDTAAHYPPRAVEDQEIRITLQARQPVASGLLRLSFAALCERAPRPGTAEGDLIFSARELGRIARMVWGEMGFDVE